MERLVIICSPRVSKALYRAVPLLEPQVFASETKEQGKRGSNQRNWFRNDQEEWVSKGTLKKRNLVGQMVPSVAQFASMRT